MARSFDVVRSMILGELGSRNRSIGGRQAECLRRRIVSELGLAVGRLPGLPLARRGTELLASFQVSAHIRNSTKKLGKNQQQLRICQTNLPSSKPTPNMYPTQIMRMQPTRRMMRAPPVGFPPLAEG